MGGALGFEPDPAILKMIGRLIPILGKQIAEDIFYKKIFKAYTEPHRHYHGVNHLQYLFREFDLIQHQLHDQQAVILAIFFHDYVYDPRASNNEERSAEEMERLLKAVATQALIDRTKHMILATKTHGHVMDHDTQFFLDIDMSPLGAPNDEWIHLEAGVRKEYKHLMPQDWRYGRWSFLNELLRQPIYQTIYFQIRHQANARANILHSISDLRSENESANSGKNEIIVYSQIMKNGTLHEFKSCYSIEAIWDFYNLTWSQWIFKYTRITQLNEPAHFGAFLSDMTYEAKEHDIAPWLFRELNLSGAKSWYNKAEPPYLLVIVSRTYEEIVREMRRIVDSGEHGDDLWSRTLGIEPSLDTFYEGY